MKWKTLQPFVVTLSILLIFLMTQIFFPTAIGFLVPGLLLFVPLWILPPPRETGFFPVFLSTLMLDRSWRQLGISLLAFVLTVLIVFPPYLVGAHYWMLTVFGFQGFAAAPLRVFLEPIPYQILLVALPEELYFRGYLQNALSKVFPLKWRLLGANLGWGWIVTAAIFAFAHSVIELKWWHFSIFFPALLFGYLKERYGSLTAPILFHAFCNYFMNWFAASYYR